MEGEEGEKKGAPAPHRACDRDPKRFSQQV